MLAAISERNTLIWAWLSEVSLMAVAWSAFFLSLSGHDLPGLVFVAAVIVVVSLHLGFAACVRNDSVLTEHLRWRFGRYWAYGPVVVCDFLLFTYSSWYRRHSRYKTDPDRTP